jgi:TRAP-type C4-dicarboxylate transport system permease small subunit
MQGLYIGCIALSGLAMVAITVIIPSGVFMRYVMNDPLQWPEPA